MIDEQTLHLMNTEIDGVNSAVRSGRLRDILESDEEAMAYFASLKGVLERIDADPLVDPPLELRQRILDAIPFGQLPAGDRSTGLDTGESRWVRWLSVLFPQPTMRYAGIFGLGLVFGVIVFTAGSLMDSPPPANLQGTMMVLDGEAGESIGHLEVEAPGVSGHIDVRSSANHIVAECTIGSSSQIEWALSYNADVVLESISRADGGLVGVRTTDTGIRFTHSGDGRYTIVFARDPAVTESPLVLVTSGGQTIYEKHLPWSK